MAATGNGEGFVMIPNWIARTGFLNPAEYMLYGYLLGRANSSGQCWPSLSKIASETGISKSTIQRALDRLVKRGIVRRTARRTKAGDWDSTVYTVTRYPLTRPREQDGLFKTTTPSNQGDSTSLFTVTNEVETPLTRSTEVEVEVAPTARHDKETKPTAAQLQYLSDLAILTGQGVPTDEERRHWADSLTASEVSDLIDAHTKHAGRGIDYSGPWPHDPEYEALSAAGKAMANNELIPNS